MTDPVAPAAGVPAKETVHDGITDAAAPAFTAPAEDVFEAMPAAEVEGKKWKRALVIYGAHKIPTNETRPVIVVEGWADAEFDTRGNVTKDSLRVTGDYAKKGDLYFRTEADTDFGLKEGPDAPPVLTLGDNVQQGGTWGMSPHPDFVNVGPAHPAYAGINLAVQRGAEDVEVIGLTEKQKAQLKPWLDALPTDLTAPSTVKVTLS